MRPILLSVLSFITLCAVEGPITYTGSSTVFPIVVAAGERYVEVDAKSRIEAQPTGSSAGIRALIGREAVLCGASRSITTKEVAAAAAAKVDFIEVPVAYDGLTVVCNPRNTFLRTLTLDELRKVFMAGGATTWKQVRAEWPDSKIVAYALGKDSGTRAFFSEVVLKEIQLRDDAIGSQDAHSIVQGVSAEVNGIGFFGAAYLEENASLLRAIAIDNGHGAHLPTKAEILDGTYQPLSRPIFIYASVESAARAQVQSFLTYVLDNPSIIDQVGYVPLPAAIRDQVRERLSKRTSGSLLADRPVGTSLAAVLPGSATAKPAVAAAAPPAAAKSAPAAAVVPTAAAAAAAIAAPAAPTALAAAPAVPAAPAAPAWNGPSAQQYRLELDQLRAAALDLARRSLDESSTVEDLVRRSAALQSRAAGLSERFSSAPRTPGAQELSLAEAGKLAR